MSTMTRIVLATVIVLSSAVTATAQARYHYRTPYGRGSLRSLAAPPPLSDYPSTTGGGSVGYNENLRRDDW